MELSCRIMISPSTEKGDSMRKMRRRLTRNIKQSKRIKKEAWDIIKRVNYDLLSDSSILKELLRLYYFNVLHNANEKTKYHIREPVKSRIRKYRHNHPDYFNRGWAVFNYKKDVIERVFSSSFNEQIYEIY